MTPTTPRNCPSKDIEKVTPGGTKLPEGLPPIEKGEREPTPPPMPPVPPLPWGNYEVYNEAGVNKWLGPQPAPTESMHDGGDLQGFWMVQHRVQPKCMSQEPKLAIQLWIPFLKLFPSVTCKYRMPAWNRQIL